jgi:hypothetical protein
MGEGLSAAADEHMVGGGGWTNERPRCCIGHQADKDERVGIRFSVSERDRVHSKPYPDGRQGWTTMA